MEKEPLYNEFLNFSTREHEALMGVWWSGQLLKKFGKRFFSEYLSSTTQFNILLLLSRADHAMNQQELSNKLLVDKSNLTGIAGRMEESGLLTRRSDPSDNRSYQLTLTDHGREVLAHVEQPYRDGVGRLMKNFSYDELTTLIEFMERLQRTVNEELDAPIK